MNGVNELFTRDLQLLLQHVGDAGSLLPAVSVERDFFAVQIVTQVPIPGFHGAKRPVVTPSPDGSCVEPKCGLQNFFAACILHCLPNRRGNAPPYDFLGGTEARGHIRGGFGRGQLVQAAPALILLSERTVLAITVPWNCIGISIRRRRRSMHWFEGQG